MTGTLTRRTMEFVPVDHELITESPVPVWFTEWEPTPAFQSAPASATADWAGLYRQYGQVLFRGTGLNRLPTILANGVDVEPPTHHIYASMFDKAWEYGKYPKVVAAYRADRLDRTYRALPLGPGVDEAEVRGEFPHEYTYDMAGVRFLSKLVHTTIGGPGYEWAFGYWIPGDPHEALVGLFAYGTPSDLAEIRGHLDTRAAARRT